MDRRDLIYELRHCERMETLSGQTATISTFAAITWSMSVCLNGSRPFGLPLTIVGAVVFTALAYATWRYHKHCVEECRSIEKRLAAPIPHEFAEPRNALSGVAKATAERITPQHSTLLH
ncbi:MAG TPA: hypothetical protein VHC22_12895 [Pirellulales bacterium]|nr:hypothetical protein [Pirellulales bacterium]